MDQIARTFFHDCALSLLLHEIGGKTELNHGLSGFPFVVDGLYPKGFELLNFGGKLGPGQKFSLRGGIAEPSSTT